MKKYLSLIVAKPQKFVDAIGMYRVVTLALLGVLVCSLGAGLLGWLAYSPLVQLQAVVPAVLLALGLNMAIAKLAGIHANHESAIITALILFFLVIPASTFLGNWALFAAVAVGIISKFVLVYRKQHIFNAAALGALALSLPGFYEFSWWVGNPVLFWPVLILGVLIVMKIRKWTPVVWFIGVGLIVFLFEGWRLGFPLQSELLTYFLSWPTLFLAFFMLTEPFTMPPTKKTQAWYGGVVGALANTTAFSAFFPMSPELALVIGNAAVYPFRLRRKLFLTLEAKELIAKDIWEFVFTKPEGFNFKAGQYLEWMLPHDLSDSRGERRYFTIASSPTEDKVRLALKLVEGGSSYKKHLAEMPVGAQLIASQLAGDFLLPKNEHQKLGFIAGGIGVTPFSSHIQFLKDSQWKCDVKLLYCVNELAELAYKDAFEAAHPLSLELIPVVAKETVSFPHEAGFITKELLERRVSDFKERHWYLSGPPPMVNAYDVLLHSLGVPTKNITKDFFPGLA